VINENAHIRAALSARGIALKQVADACGISKGAVSQWFLSGPGWRPVPEHHMATIRELLASSPQERRQVEAFERLAEGQSAGNPGAPARRRSPPPARPSARPRRSPPQPRSPIHYPEHWAPPPVMPAQACTSSASGFGPLHSDFVAEHNQLSQYGKRRDVPGHAELPFGPLRRLRQ
jgi:hypothetical protein